MRADTLWDTSVLAPLVGDVACCIYRPAVRLHNHLSHFPLRNLACRMLLATMKGGSRQKRDQSSIVF